MWIECGIINYKLIMPLIYPALFQIRIIIHKDEEKPFKIFFTNYLGYLFSDLIYLPYSIFLCPCLIMSPKKFLDFKKIV